MASSTQLSPVVRVFRTVIQLVVAVAALVPTLVVVLHSLGVKSVNEAGLLALAATAMTAVTSIQNALEHAGIIPTLGAAAPVAAPVVPVAAPEPKAGA
jgi:uncharacterized membrane protein (Fun14 family)